MAMSPHETMALGGGSTHAERTGTTAVAVSASAVGLVMQTFSPPEAGAVITTPVVEGVQLRQSVVEAAGKMGARESAIESNCSALSAPSSGTAGDGSSNSSACHASSSGSNTGKSAIEGRKVQQGASIAAASRALTVATCSAQERVQRIVELKRTLDRFREEDLSESVGVRKNVAGTAETASSMHRQQGTEAPSIQIQKRQQVPLHTSSLLDIFAVLAEVNMNREILSKTRIGVTVGKLRSHSSAEVRSRASELVVKWKACLGSAAPASTDSTPPNAADTSIPVAAATSVKSSPVAMGEAPSGATSVSPSEASSAAAATGVVSRPGCMSPSAPEAAAGRSPSPSALKRYSKEEPPYNGGVGIAEKTGHRMGGTASPSSVGEYFPGPLTGDSVRDRARMFLWKALLDGMHQQQREVVTGVGGEAAAARPPTGGETAAQVASQVEEALWKEYCERRRNTKEYTAQLKTLKWNLADPKNPDLNLKVLCGVFSPEQLATMTSADLASDEKKRLREQQKKESMEACQSDWEMKKLMQGAGAEGQFPCFKCRTTKTVYFQMQTRSSDEPMTTFVTCLECGNRWKF